MAACGHPGNGKNPPSSREKLLLQCGPVLPIFRRLKAALAQPVEHIIRNDGVACSSHAGGTRLRTRQRKKPARRSPKGEAWASLRALRLASRPSPDPVIE